MTQTQSFVTNSQKEGVVGRDPKQQAAAHCVFFLLAYDHVCAHETADYIRKYSKDDFDPPRLIKLVFHAVDRAKPLISVFGICVLLK